MIATFKQVLDVYGQVMLGVCVLPMLMATAVYIAHLGRRLRDYRRRRQLDAEAYRKVVGRLDEVTTELDAVMAKIFDPQFPRDAACGFCHATYHVESPFGVRDAIALHHDYDCAARTRQDAQ